MGTVNLLSSGLDVQTLVDGLISLEAAPITRMQAQTSTLQSKITAFQSLNTKLSSLLTKVDRLLFNGDTPPLTMPATFEERLESSVFSATKATSSDETILKASAGSGAQSGTYSITTIGLAKVQTDLSSGFDSPDTSFGDTGFLEISLGGNTVSVEINSSNNTLQGTMEAINAANAGVTATIVNDGTEDPYKLVINSDNPGLANAFTITKAEGWAGSSLSFTNKVGAADAHINVNGIDIFRSSNTISDVIAGTTLTLNNTSTTAVSVTVAPDFDAMASALKDVVSAYNDVNSSISTQSRYNAVTKTAGVLSGDSTLRGIQSKVQAVITEGVSNGHTSFSLLSQIGIKFNNDGSLSFDESKFKAAAADDLTSVAALVLGDGAAPGSSSMIDMHNALESITDPLTGPIHNSTAALSQNIQALNDRISEYQDRLEVRRTLLTAEFNKADQALRLLSVNQTSLTSLTASLANLAG